LTADRELRWSAARLLPHESRLKSFAALRDQFYQEFMTNSPTAAAGVLDEVEHSLGFSLWLLKSRFAVFQVTGGLQEQKAYLDRIRRVAPSDGVTAFLAYFVSNRNEPTVTLGRLRSQFEMQLARMETPDSLNSWLRYHITPDAYPADQQTVDILRYASTGTAIDTYLALLDRLRVLAVQPNGPIRPVIASITRKQLDATADPQLRGILAWLESTSEYLFPLSGDVLAMKDACTCGALDNASAIGSRLLVSSAANALDAFICLVHTTAIDPKVRSSVDPSLPAERIIDRLAKLLRKDSSLQDDYAEVAKVAVNFSDSMWAHAISGILEHDNDEALTSPPGGSTHLAAVSLPTLDPQRLQWWPPGATRESLASSMLAQYGKRPSVIAAVVASGGDDTTTLSASTSRDEAALSEALHSLHHRDGVSALPATGRLMSSTYAMYRRYGAAIRTMAMLQLGDHPNALTTITTAALGEPHWQASLPLAAVARALGEHRSAQVSRLADTPILFDLCSRHLGSAFDRERVFALRDLLRAWNTPSPSTLAGLIVGGDTSKLSYLLRNICVEAVLDRTGMFASSRALLEERLAVCRVLIKLDPANQELYVAEIAGLLRRQTRQRRIREVEQSKIYVDIESIKRLLITELQDSYSRYLSLQPVTATEDLLAGLQAALDELTAGNPQGISALVLPKNEAYDLLADIARRLVDEYLLSSEHGLDKYLSVRIRHGALATHLRRPFEARHFMTVREAHSARYRLNEYWPNNITGPKAALESVASRLAKFSGDYNTFIEEVRSRIAIRKSEADVGLFDIPLRAGLLLVLAGEATPETSFDQFIDAALTHLGTLLDANLARVRNYLTVDARSRATALVDELLHDLEALEKDGDFGLLLNATRTCRTELQFAFGRLAEWFQRGGDVANEPFPLQDAIDVAAEVVRMGCLGLGVEIKGPPDVPLLVDGHLFSTFYDIFVILFENAVKHSGLEQSTSIEVEVIVREGTVDVIVTNAVAPEVDWSHIRERATRIIEEVRAGRQKVAVSREGGTGLHKLGRLLTHDVGVTLDLEVDLAEQSVFSVRFGLPTRSIDGSAASEILSAAGLADLAGDENLTRAAPELRMPGPAE
jgi:hypothetical protein